MRRYAIALALFVGLLSYAAPAISAVLAVAAAGAAIGYGVGAAVGYASIGLSIGWAVGSYIGQMLFAPEQRFEGPRLSDLQVQSSTDGSPVPLAYGTIRLPGKIFWAAPIKETQHEEDVGGKGALGGSSQTSVTYTYSVDMALSFCEGPIVGIRRIWMDGKLVYSIAAGANPATFAANTDRGAIAFYLGTETQTADPTISAVEGAANTPGYRGTAYMVFTNWQLKDFANHIPFVEAEVVVTGTDSFPYYIKQANSPAETLKHLTLDTRRLSAFYVSDHPSVGESIWRWGFNNSDPTVFATFDAALITLFTPSLNADVYGLGIQADRDELLVHGGGPGEGIPFAIFDLSTGALRKTAQPMISGVSVAGASESVSLRTRLYYDAEGKKFWGLGDGVSSGDLYVISLIVQTEQALAFVVDESSNTINPDHQPLVDANGRLWLLTGDRIVRAGTDPLAYTLPVAGSPQTAFMWAARQEIWVARASGHATSGWMVFDMASETFDDSINLFGGNTFTRDYVLAVGNRNGHAWFIGDTAGLADATLRDTNGVEVDATSGEIDFVTSNWNSIEYVTGVVVANIDDYTACWYEQALEPGSAPLDDVVTDLCARVGLTDIDVSQLVSDSVRGFVVARPMAARNAIEPLQMAFSFDGVESDSLIRFVKRGAASVVTIPQADMAAREGEPGSEPIEPFVRTRALETELPATIHLRYINVSTDYNIAAETARRLTTQAKNTFETELPLVLTSQEANRLADTIMRLAWLERERLSFFLGPKYSYLDPTDIVTLYDGTRVRLVRISQDVNGILSCEGVNDDDSALTSYATGSVDEWTGAVTLGSTGVTLPAIIDGPLLLDRHDDVGWIIGACGEDAGWPGGAMYQSKDGGLSYGGIAALATAARIGSIVDGELVALAMDEANRWDHASEITVRLAQPDLTIATPASLEAFYQGDNAFLVSDEGEDWELAQGYNVTANADGTYTLRNFLRGRKGTEHFAGPWKTGARVVFADAARLVNVAASLSDVGSEILFKAVATGGSIIDEVTRTRTFDAIAAKPLSPVEIGGTLNAAGDIVIEWVRRARKDADWRSGGGAPLDEDLEAYEVEIWDDGYGTLYRTLEVTGATTTTYTAAMNTADFGTPVAYVAVRIYQLSDRVGRGYPGEGRVGTLPVPVEFSASLTTAGLAIQAAPYRHRRVVRSGSSTEWAPCSRTFATGKWYWEISVDAYGSEDELYFGITQKTAFASGDAINTTDQRVWRGDGALFSSGAGSPNTAGYSITGTSTLVRFAWDAGAGLLWIGYGPNWRLGIDPSTGLGHNTSHTPGANWRPVLVAGTIGSAYTASASFERGNQYRPPAGFRLIQ